MVSDNGQTAVPDFDVQELHPRKMTNSNFVADANV